MSVKQSSISTTVDSDFLDNFHLIANEDRGQSKLKFFCPLIDANSLNYENLINIYYARRAHKLAEWHVLCDWIMSLPYAAELIAVKEE